MDQPLSNCCSHETLLHFSLQSSHLNICSQSVLQRGLCHRKKIERLPPSQKEVAEDAYLFLMSSRRSAYKQFVRKHETVVANGGDRKQSLNILQTRYIECALWPDLYPFKKWCDSFWDGSHEKYASAEGVTSPRACPQFWFTEYFTSCCISNLTSGCSLGLRNDAVCLYIMELISSTFCATSARLHMRCTLHT